MNYLFVHNNFPGQFTHTVKALLREPSSRVAAIGSMTARPIDGVQLVRYSVADQDVSAVHPFARRFELECRRAEQVIYCATELMHRQFVPDVVVAHPGWGEALPLRSLYPKAKVIQYCEFYYTQNEEELSTPDEFGEYGVDGRISMTSKNAATLLAMIEADWCVSPTNWQKSAFPEGIQSQIEVIHDGIDTKRAKPDPTAEVRLPSGKSLSRSDRVITYVARNLEPYRGYHVLTRALPKVLSKQRDVHVVIVGGDRVSYGAPPPESAKSWKEYFLNQVISDIDMNRVHFVGRVPYTEYLKVLQISSCHVYLTYPFVLSWSMLEAMSTECLVVGSNTGPVKEVIADGENGLLVPFFDHDALAETLLRILNQPRDYDQIRKNARDVIVTKYDIAQCVPRFLSLVRDGR